jgi:nitrile hydratase
MNGVHDMGGMHGFGTVEPEPNEPVFHADWEAHVLAMNRRLSGRLYHLDEMRNAIEHLPPAQYLGSSYYARWLAAIENLVAEKVPPEGSPPPRLERPTPPAVQPRFKVGDAVVTRRINPVGHTRLPRYARGKRGRIASVKGPYLLPDTNAHQLSQDWQPVYAVRFEARELWGEQASPRTSVCVDIWESHLEPAPAMEGDTR